MSMISDLAGGFGASMMQGMHRAHQPLNAGQLTKDVFSQLDPTGQGSIDSQQFLAALTQQLNNTSNPSTTTTTGVGYQLVG